MSSGPPSYTPPPPAPAPRRQGFFDSFRGMRWWEIVLVALPLTLIAVGGLVGGVLGALAAIGNVYVARSSLSTTVKVAVMLGLLVSAYVLWLIIAMLVLAAMRSSSA